MERGTTCFFFFFFHEFQCALDETGGRTRDRSDALQPLAEVGKGQSLDAGSVTLGSGNFLVGCVAPFSEEEVPTVQRLVGLDLLQRLELVFHHRALSQSLLALKLLHGNCGSN